jgi:CRISPR-associated protein Csa3
MVRTYVSTLGFHETRVTRPVLRRGLDDEDTVVLVRPAHETADGRAADAVDYVTDMLAEIAPGATVETENIDTADFVGAVRACGDVLRAATGELVVNLGGGAREVYLPLTVATILSADRVDVALQYTDIRQEIREWPVPNLTATIPESARSTLALIGAREETSIPELTEASEKSKSTITRHVDRLTAVDAIETRREGKTKRVALRPTGRILLDADG